MNDRPRRPENRSAASRSASEETPPELTFEQSLQMLEDVVRRLEEGGLSLSDSLSAYERGVQQLKHCYRLLEQAEGRIEQLVRIDSEGNAVLQDFGDEGDSQDLEEKQKARARRRGAARPRDDAQEEESEGPRRKRRPRGDVDETGGLF